MPYTPPSQQSPASSKPNSPVISRSHSYSQDHPSHSTSSRPQLPRSNSSIAYLQKHRRTPSISKANGSPSAQDDGVKYNGEGSGPQSNGSLHQSPLPISNSLIPPGAILSPPDSSQNSDDDDGTAERRGRQLPNLAELQEAVRRSIDVKRQHSPNRDVDMSKLMENLALVVPAVSAHRTSASEPTSARPGLSAEARKISHSRSSTETSFLAPMNSTIADSPVQTSDDSDVEDDELRIKPPLLRKKSGELVKPALRPPSRRRPSSMPGTPTFSKAVHFNEDIEQVRHFLQVDRPIAVSAGSSPVETYDSETDYPFGTEESYRSKQVEWEIKLANFPEPTPEREILPVCLERLFLSADNKTLVGTVAVANLAFHKLVVARFTLDYWKTTSEVVAEYNNDVRRQQQANDGKDRFNFNIKLADQAHLETKTMLLCVRYNVNGQEYWDNNNFMNFQVDFLKKAKSPSPKQPVHSLGTRPLNAIPRSRNSTSQITQRPRSMPPGSFEDDFGGNFQFGPTKVSLGQSGNNTIRLKPKHNRPGGFTDAPRRSQSAGQPFATRYDFSASLSAALQNAQTAMGDRSGLKPKEEPKNSATYFTKKSDFAAPASTTGAPAVASPPPEVDTARLDQLSSDKPALESAEYNELIQRYCFFGTSGKVSPQNERNEKNTAARMDGTNDSSSDYSDSSNQGSGSNTPSPQWAQAVDGTNDSKVHPRTAATGLSRSASPASRRSASPISFGYPYNHHNGHGSLFSENHLPTAIRS